MTLSFASNDTSSRKKSVEEMERIWRFTVTRAVGIKPFSNI